MVRANILAILLFSTVTAALSCQPDSDHRTELPGEDFQQDTDVRVLSPSNGETVAAPFVLVFEAGVDVARVRLDANGGVVVDEQAIGKADGQLTVSLDPGRYTLGLVGADDDGIELSRHELTVRVAEADESWVTIVSPADGSEVSNPVRFVVDASADVDSVSGVRRSGGGGHH